MSNKKKILIGVGLIVAAYFIYHIGFLVGLGDAVANTTRITYIKAGDESETIVQDTYRYIDGEWQYQRSLYIPVPRPEEETGLLPKVSLGYEKYFKLAKLFEQESK